MRVLVCGGRFFSNRTLSWQWLDGLHVRTPITLIIEGGAAGADRLARAWALKRGVPFTTFPAEWADMSPPCVVRSRRDGTRYNAAAGGIRNQRMIDEGKPNLVVAFKGGTGTNDMINRARTAGIRVIEVETADAE